ncbi:hypothetical protein HMPREF3185_01855 [Porphyromonas somerae]|uniref:Uncharacterized protein n=1 Tax=Porphyromonas somerae TaxID=322095 RepID=A0A134B1U8_9PORP|nr:hypothetical protein HMPREF3184_01855 [Porphyromonadaceae bacterium KA00676]KXB73917.1 hypothetical protein HMPREF3185_01855 [Porphyromonas somerae]
MTYPAIYREAEYLIVGMGANARKSTPALPPSTGLTSSERKAGSSSGVTPDEHE